MNLFPVNLKNNNRCFEFETCDFSSLCRLWADFYLSNGGPYEQSLILKCFFLNFSFFSRFSQKMMEYFRNTNHLEHFNIYFMANLYFSRPKIQIIIYPFVQSGNSSAHRIVTHFRKNPIANDRLFSWKIALLAFMGVFKS